LKGPIQLGSTIVFVPIILAIVFGDLTIRGSLLLARFFFAIFFLARQLPPFSLLFFFLLLFRAL